MAKILNKKIYPIDTFISDTDMVIGSDGDNNYKTKNFTVGALKSHILEDIVDGGGDGGGGYGNGDGTFTWVMYAEDIEGNNMSPIKLISSNFIGYGFDKAEKTPSTDPKEYVWMPITFEKGRDGIDGSNGIEGLDGETGIPGPIGIDGKPTYFHIAYADDINGGGFSQHPYNKKFIGTYSDYTLADSNTPSDYDWLEVKGLDGTKGIPAINAIDGLTYYLHIAYANSEDGVVGFDIVESEDKQFIGTLVDLIEDDSLNPSAYTWSRILDPNGGIDDGDGTFTWIKYTIKPDGLNPLSDADTDMYYMGFAFKKTTAIESEDYRDYEWHLIYTNNDFNQNNLIRVIDIPSSYFGNKAVTEQTIAEWVNDNGIKVSETENIIFSIVDANGVDGGGGNPELPPPPEPPHLDTSIPLNLVLVSKTADTASFTWASSDTAFVRYELFYNNTIDNLGNLKVTSKTLTGLQPIEYSCYVIGYDTYGTAKQSNTVIFSLFVASTPNLTITQVTATGAFLDYKINDIFVANKFEIYRASGAGAFSLIYTEFGLPEGGWIGNGTRGSYYRETLLTPLTSYSYYVIAYQGAIASLQSATVTITTQDAVTPTLTAPTIALQVADYSSIKHSITIPSNEIGVVTAFRVEYRRDYIADDGTTPPWNVLPDIAYTTLHKILNLFADTAYLIRVRSISASAISTYSNIIRGVTLPDKKAKISLSLGMTLTEQDILDGYVNPISIFDGKPNSSVKVYVNALITYLGNKIGGAIIFKDSLTQVNSGYPQTLTFTLDGTGSFNDLFLIESPREGALTTVTATITESFNGIDTIYYTDTRSYTPPPLI